MFAGAPSAVCGGGLFFALGGRPFYSRTHQVWQGGEGSVDRCRFVGNASLPSDAGVTISSRSGVYRPERDASDQERCQARYEKRRDDGEIRIACARAQSSERGVLYYDTCDRHCGYGSKAHHIVRELLLASGPCHVALVCASMHHCCAPILPSFSGRFE